MIDFSKPTLRRRDMLSVLEAMADEKIGPGARAKKFAKDAALYLGREKGFVFRTYRDALLFAFSSLAVPKGSSVLVSALTPSGIARMIEDFGYELLLSDISEENGIASPEPELLFKASVAFLWAPGPNFPKKDDWEGAGIPVISDITKSIGSPEASEVGDFLISGFEEADPVSAGGGAGVFTSRSETLPPPDSSAELPDLNAALGSVQLSSISDYEERRREIFALYRSSLMRTRHKPFAMKNPEWDGNASCFTVLLEGNVKETVDFAARNDVPAKRVFADALIAEEEKSWEKFPNSAAALLRGIGFPLYYFLRKKEVDTIAKVLANLP